MAKCPHSRGDYTPVKAGELSTELTVEVAVVHSNCNLIREVSKDEPTTTEVAGAN